MARKSSARTQATPALTVLASHNVPYETHTYSSAGHDFGAEAAQVLHNALGIAPERIFKTLIVALSGSGRSWFGVAMVPVTTTLNLKAVAAAFGAARATMADKQQAQRITGYVLGGVSPLGQKQVLPSVIDTAAERAAAAGETIFCSAGKRGLEVELAPADLTAILEASYASIAS